MLLDKSGLRKKGKDQPKKKGTDISDEDLAQRWAGVIGSNNDK